jgi:6-phosphogluconolactonase
VKSNYTPHSDPRSTGLQDAFHQLKQFAIDAGSGKLTVAFNTPSDGSIPRNVVLTPDGKELLAANRDGNNIATFHRDAATGAPTRAGEISSRRRSACCLCR